MTEQTHQHQPIKTKIIRIFTDAPKLNGRLSRRQSIALVLTLPILVICLIVGIEFITAYSRYAALVDARLADQTLQQPPGIYAAPRRVSLGQRLSREELTERLLRAGYLTGAGGSDFTVGRFSLTHVGSRKGIEIYTNEFACNEYLPARLKLAFDESVIAYIEDAAQARALNQIQLPAELLSADFNSNAETRRPSSFDEIPEILIKALCATEDRRFFVHSGIDPSAIVRAAVRNVRAGAIRQGASTLTQQLIKNQFLTPERTWRRKYAEAFMAIALERRLTKKQIFELYANRIYLGHSGLTNIYGFKQAARIFLGKELNAITLTDAAFLAGLVKAPNRFAPHRTPSKRALVGTK